MGFLEERAAQVAISSCDNNNNNNNNNNSIVSHVAVTRSNSGARYLAAHVVICVFPLAVASSMLWPNLTSNKCCSGHA